MKESCSLPQGRLCSDSVERCLWSTDTAFWAVLLTATRDAVALPWAGKTILALCMSLKVYAILGHVATKLIQSNLPLWFADQKKSTKHIIHLEQSWWLYRACAATRFGTQKGKLYTGSVRSSIKHLLLSSSQNNTPLFSELEQVLQILRVQITNCLSGNSNESPTQAYC